MAEQPHGFWRGVRNRIRSRLISGLLVMVPAGITLYVLGLLFRWSSGFLREPVKGAMESIGKNYAWPPLNSAIKWFQIHHRAESIVAGMLAIVALLALLYLIGLIAAHVVGRRLISRFEKFVLQVPIVKSIYSAAKQLVEALSLPDKKAFQSVVLIEMFNPEYQCFGFLTGTMCINGRTLCRVFVPTVPNITTGFYMMVPPEQVRETDMLVEDAFKALISGGLISPETMTVRPCRYIDAPAPLAAERSF